MRDRDLILVIIFIVIPLLQWIARQIQEARARSAKARSDASTSETVWTSSDEARPAERPDEDVLPEWFPEGVWETVQEPEPVRREEAPAVAATPPPPPPERPTPASLLPSLTSAASSLAADRARIGDLGARPLGEETPAVGRAAKRRTGSSRSRTSRSRLRKSHPLAGRSELQKAVLWSEILGKPRALNPHSTDER